MSKNVNVRMQGGLGNQIFQYAMGRSRCFITGENLVLDISGFENDHKRNFELNNYNIIAQTNKDTGFENYYKLVQNMQKYAHLKLFFNKAMKIAIEKEEFGFEPYKTNRYFWGYWQNDNYFKNIKEQLSKELVYNGELNEIQKALIENIKKQNSVAMHIRRGDYLSVENVDLFCKVTKTYYLSALDYLKKELKDEINIYIFSDDIEWCKTEYRDLKDVQFIDNTISDNHLTDFEIMRNCRHFIIANSTFSWWAAWLGEDENKIIIAPEKWYCDEEKNEKLKAALLADVIVM